MKEISEDYIDDLVADIKFNYNLLSSLLDKGELSPDEERLMEIVVELLKQEKEELAELSKMDDFKLSEQSTELLESMLK